MNHQSINQSINPLQWDSVTAPTKSHDIMSRGVHVCHLKLNVID